MTYESEEMVDECQANRPHKIDGATVETKRATPRYATQLNKERSREVEHSYMPLHLTAYL